MEIVGKVLLRELRLNFLIPPVMNITPWAIHDHDRFSTWPVAIHAPDAVDTVGVGALDALGDLPGEGTEGLTVLRIICNICKIRCNT